LFSTPKCQLRRSLPGAALASLQSLLTPGHSVTTDFQKRVARNFFRRSVFLTEPDNASTTISSPQGKRPRRDARAARFLCCNDCHRLGEIPAHDIDDGITGIVRH
jgi:hypothetical protein